MILYIAGPMTGIPEYNRPAFNAAEGELTAAGYKSLNPARQPVVEGRTWQDYMRLGLGDLIIADGVAVLDGWRESKGAKLEVLVATELGMRVAPVAEWIAEVAS